VFRYYLLAANYGDDVYLRRPSPGHCISLAKRLPNILSSGYKVRKLRSSECPNPALHENADITASIMLNIDTLPSPRNTSVPLQVQSRLSTLRVCHLDNLDTSSLNNIVHRLRRNEDELAADRTSCSLNDHVHTPLTVDAVHEDVEFVKAADRRAHGVPKREQQTHGRVRFLAARECLRLPAISALLHNVRLNLAMSVTC
jgi:hypothetical protein